jgi:hypothetical protein
MPLDAALERLAQPEPADPEITKLTEEITTGAPPAAPEPTIPMNDPLALATLKDEFMNLSPRDKYLFREWVVEQICGEVLH